MSSHDAPQVRVVTLFPYTVFPRVGRRAKRVALVAESVHDADEAVDVARVEADGGFVEHEQRAGEGGAEAGGEIDALDLAAGEGAGGAVEREVAKADLVEVAEP